MRPMRGSRFGGGFGGGFPGLESMSAKLAVGLVAGSVLYLLTKNTGGALLLLTPGFLGSYLWQPFSYAFIERSPLGIIFGAIIIWSIGGWLEGVWGSRRMLLVTLGCTVLAGFATALLLPLLVDGTVPYAGGTVMASVLWVAYGLTIGRGQTNFWGIALSGNAFAGIGAGFVLLGILTAGNLYMGFLGQLPDVLALLFVFVYMKGANPRRLWLHFQHWRLQRQLRGRARNLRVVSHDRPSDDQYLN
jgi:membrane associated rhomboid family serine protease